MNNKLFSNFEELLNEHVQTMRERAESGGPISADYRRGYEDAITVVKKIYHELNREWLTSAVYDHPPHPHPRSRTYRSEPVDWAIEDVNSASLKSQIAHRANQILERRSDKKLAIVFDLDGTLFDVGHRTLGILKRWLSLSESQRFPKPLIKKVESIGFNHIGYSLAHAFENAGLDMRNPEVMEVLVTVERFWRKKFFDGESLVEFDAVYSGAADFVWFCKRLGLKIFYLTGRSHKVMFQGTQKQLEKFGFPMEESEFVLKMNTVTDDAVFKEEAFRAICKSHEVVGNFENEYVNIRGMVECEPHAVHVIVDSQHSGRPVYPLAHKVYRIQSFA